MEKDQSQSTPESPKEQARDGLSAVNGSEEILRWIQAAKTLPPVPEPGLIQCRDDLRFLAIEYPDYDGSRRRSWELLDLKGQRLGVTFNEEILPQNK